MPRSSPSVRRAVVAMTALPFVLAAAARSQSINLDIGAAVPFGQPNSAFGAAANQAGIWNHIPGNQGLYGNVIGTNSVATPVRVSLSTGTSGVCQFPCAGALPGGSNHEVLLDDFCRFNGDLTVEIRDLVPGYYNVFTYGWAADDPLARTTVDGVQLGGPWPAANNFVQGTTHSVRNGVPVAPGTALTIRLSVANTFGTLNGIQLVFTGGTLGTSYCPGNRNSTGYAAALVAFGSATAGDNELFLSCAGLPRHSFVFFLTSLTPGFVANAGGSSGNLCLGGAIGRGVGGQIYSSGPLGYVTAHANLMSHPTPTGPTVVQAGQTWHFQCWYRDHVQGAATSNYSAGWRLSFL